MGIGALLDRLHQFRPHLPLDQIEVTLLDKDQKEQPEIAPGSLLYFKGTKIWRCSQPEESKRQGVEDLDFVSKEFSADSARPVLGYCVSKKLNKGYVYRTENSVDAHPDSYYDEAAAHFVHKYLEPKLTHNGARRSAADIAKDMRFNIIAHSYNEFPVMIENAFRDLLKAQDYSTEDQKKIMSQVFALEVGCHHHKHDQTSSFPSFMHMELSALNDQRVDAKKTEQAFGAATPLFGNASFVDEKRSAMVQFGPARIGVLVKVPDFVKADNEPNRKGHNFKGYIEVMPERAKEIAKEMIEAKELPGIFDLSLMRDHTSTQWGDAHAEEKSAAKDKARML